MLNVTNNLDPFNSIETWYVNRCNGDWEHNNGVTIESTDNPGWLITFTDMRIPSDKLAKVLGSLLESHDAQVTRDESTVRVFSSSLRGCLAAASILVGITDSQVGPALPDAED